MRNDSPRERVSKAEKLRLHRQRMEALARRQRQHEQRIATRRQAIAGVRHLHGVLQEIEFARAKLRAAQVNLATLLRTAPLAHAYGDFHSSGGVSGSDWQRWLNGESMDGGRHAAKRHLRIVSARHTPSIARRPLTHVAKVVEEDAWLEEDVEAAELEEWEFNDGPEAA
jgi:multidrug efflux pump subunit AcrA (membrane-fusion protein)